MNTQQLLARKRAKIRSLLADSGNQIFTVEFYKKGDWKKGEMVERKMNARTGVQKDLKGGVSTIAGKEDIAGCYEMNGNGYRAFWLDGVISFKCKGHETTFSDFPEAPLMKGATA